MIRTRHPATRWMRLSGLIALIAMAVYTYAPAQGSQGGANRVYAKTGKAVSLRPTLARDFKPGRPLSRAQVEAMSDKLYSIRRHMAAEVEPAAGGGVLPHATATETRPEAGPRFHGNPGTLIVGRNNVNNRANNDTCGTGSTLAEPAASNEGAHVYYTGNLRHQEFSVDGGATYACAAAYPQGPAEAPIAFGDTDVVYDHSRGVTFHSVLYVDANINNGVIGVFVRRNINLADNCFYIVDSDPQATNVLDDYPHLGLSNNFLYMSANRVQRPFGPWLGAFIERLNVDQMADCVTASGSFVNFTNPGGQRILVPGQGARDVMYMAWVNTTSQWRVFSWADGSNTIFSSFINVGAMTFGDPDCRGGANNADWADSLSANIVGFNVRATVGRGFVTVWAATAADASHPQAHVHGAEFRIGPNQYDLTLVQEPVIWNPDNCFGIPTATVNDRGDVGMALAFGSRAGGGGSAVATGVLMKDEFSPGPGGFSFTLVATGTHNPTRYGDYFTPRRNAPCGEWFDSTGYALSGGTALANVNARYVEFGRGRDEQCYLAWRNSVPAS
jgi:hypothetical protein